MLKHIVMFKLENKTNENMEEAITALKGMEGKIEPLNFIEVGTDITHSERSYDIVLTTHFDSQEELKLYAEHPNHQTVLKTMAALCSKRAVVDYETA